MHCSKKFKVAKWSSIKTTRQGEALVVSFILHALPRSIQILLREGHSSCTRCACAARSDGPALKGEGARAGLALLSQLQSWDVNGAVNGQFVAH
jgi:hypothetical protein